MRARMCVCGVSRFLVRKHQNIMSGCQRQGIRVGIRGEGGQKVQTSSYIINNSCDIIHSMMTIVNNTVLHIYKLLQE